MTCHAFDLYLVPEVHHPALHRHRGHARKQLEPDVRATRNNCGQSNRRNGCYCGPYTGIPHVWRFSDWLWLLCSAPYPREQSMSNVTAIKSGSTPACISMVKKQNKQTKFLPYRNFGPYQYSFSFLEGVVELKISRLTFCTSHAVNEETKVQKQMKLSAWNSKLKIVFANY